MRQKTCSACGDKMQSLGNMELQKGKFSMLFGHWDQILSGALDVDVECCERCKKLEFYLLGDAEVPESSGIQQIACPLLRRSARHGRRHLPPLRQTADGVVTSL